MEVENGDGTNGSRSEEIGAKAAPHATTSTDNRTASFTSTSSPPSFAPFQSQRSVQHKSSYDVSKSMERLRSSMIGNVSWIPGRHEKEDYDELGQVPTTRTSTTTTASPATPLPPSLHRALGQIPAIVLIGIFHLMIGIPFGASYFPIGWKAPGSADDEDENDDDGVHGIFPLPGKEALGIRMFLFSTILGQIVFTGLSGFRNPVGLQMVENVPFCHELATIAVRHQGYTREALSTLFAMYGFSSLLVGAVFYALGRWKLGNVVYYFPKHVLVGCIGGIGLYIAKTGVEVTMNAEFSLRAATVTYGHLLVVVLAFEVVLRLLEFGTRDVSGNARYPLLSPLYFCSITPVFYMALFVLGVNIETATEEGFFFPALDKCTIGGGENGEACSTSLWDSIFDQNLFNIWKVVNFSTVSFPALMDAIPTLVALTLFSLIHVPINIPAFANSTDTDVDMNKELIAHGYSNLLVGIFGGLQNYMAYTQSVLYDKSGGTGKASGYAVAGITSVLFLIGPTIASYIPRCMAGTLLVHVGVDLFLEGVYETWGKFDALEYGGIWLITMVMTLYGMEAAMIAGFITALFTYAVQNTTYVHILRGSMSAATLRSSKWNRSTRANAILADESTGRNRILVVQLQGHLFFGNMVQLTQSVNDVLSEKAKPRTEPWIVIIDFGLVLGIDSSAAQSISKLSKTLQHKHGVDLCIFVTGSGEGFPTAYSLSKELSTLSSTTPVVVSDEDVRTTEATPLLAPFATPNPDTSSSLYTGSRVCTTLDDALVFAEDALLARTDWSLLEADRHIGDPLRDGVYDITDETRVALRYLENLCPRGVDQAHVGLLWKCMTRETYVCGDSVWLQGSESDCMKLLLRGTLLASLENEAGTNESIAAGNTIGELGLVEHTPRMSSVTVVSADAVLYSLHRERWRELKAVSPHAASLTDRILIRYLSARVQHVSNRIYETRCLPI
jgi:SulP family sulfate permease